MDKILIIDGRWLNGNPAANRAVFTQAIENGWEIRAPKVHWN